MFDANKTTLGEWGVFCRQPTYFVGFKTLLMRTFAMLNFNKFDDVSEILLEYRLNVPYLLCAVGNLQESATSNLSQQEEEGRASWARWDGCTANKLAERAHICRSLRCITTFASTLTCWKLEPVLWKNGLKMQLASKLAYCYYIM